MTCEQAQTDIHEHLDGEDHPAALRAHAHSSECEVCKTHFSALLEVETQLRTMRKLEAPNGLKDKVMKAISQVTPLTPRADHIQF